MIEVRGVSKSFHTDDPVLSDLNFELGKGDFLYVVGGTGAGKTTLLRLLATEERPTTGEIKLFGYNIRRVSPSTLQAIRRAIGYIPQRVQLIKDLSVFDNVVISLSVSGRHLLNRKTIDRVHEVLARLELDQKANVRADVLSGGEAQRVAVARALVRSPQLIIADEPTGAQDRSSTWKIMDLFSKAGAEGCSLLVATHDSEIVRRVRKKSIVLESGKVRVENQACIF